MVSLPGKTEIGHVHLQVSHLGKAMTFYSDLLGFKKVWEEGRTAFLSATGHPPYHILLTERPGARTRPPDAAGIYHVAIRLPNRHELARIFLRILMQRRPYEGLSDHRVSEAVYLIDPDGIGIELCADRPRQEWPREDDQIEMTTGPLDCKSLLHEVELEKDTWTGIHPEADIGHVHLRVSDLSRAGAFYHDLLGFVVNQRDFPGALFLSAGGYHHHIALNVWGGAGKSPAPPDSAGLLSFALSIPDREAWNNLKKRLTDDGIRLETGRRYPYASGILVRDPDGNGVEILKGGEP